MQRADPPGMPTYHHVALSLPETRLFDDVVEARALWLATTRSFPDLIALCLMPDHIHLLHPRYVPHRVSRLMSGYARWRNHHRRTPGSVWAPQRPVEEVAEGDHRRRMVRYIHLNPCRRKPLVGDPLAWPFSTHRDALGLARDPVIPRVASPRRFHRFVSSDSWVDPAGTPLPHPTHPAPGRAGLLALREAYLALARLPAPAVAHHGPSRAELGRLLRGCTPERPVLLARFLGVHPSGPARASSREQGWMAPYLRALDDPRFATLEAMNTAILRYPPYRRPEELH